MEDAWATLAVAAYLTGYTDIDREVDISDISQSTRRKKSAAVQAP
jgi:hypothetical protein